MIVVVCIVLVAQFAALVLLYRDNQRLRNDLVTALTHPPSVAGAILGRKPKDREPPAPAKHPLGM